MHPGSSYFRSNVFTVLWTTTQYPGQHGPYASDGGNPLQYVQVCVHVICLFNIKSNYDIDSGMDFILWTFLCVKNPANHPHSE